MIPSSPITTTSVAIPKASAVELWSINKTSTLPPSPLKSVSSLAKTMVLLLQALSLLHNASAALS